MPLPADPLTKLYIARVPEAGAPGLGDKNCIRSRRARKKVKTIAPGRAIA
jgi:hypothetical protein